MEAEFIKILATSQTPLLRTSLEPKHLQVLTELSLVVFQFQEQSVILRQRIQDTEVPLVL